MAVTYRASTSTNTGSTPASSISVSVPAGVQAGDTLIAVIQVDGGSGATVTAPSSNWILAAQSNEGTNQAMYSYYKQATSSEPSSYSFTFDTTRAASAGMLAYSGVFFYLGPTSATTTASASTNMTVSGRPASAAGVFLHLFAGRNTTVSANMSQGTNATERIDTCTSATPFLNLDVQESVHRNFPPQASTTIGAVTSSQSATQITQTLFLQDARTATSLINEDWYANSTFTTARTSQQVGLFSTTYPNTLLVLIAEVRGGTNVINTVTSSNTVSGWTRRARANTNASCVEIWTAVSANTSAISPNITYSASTTSGSNLVFGLIGADISNPVGAVLTDSFTGGTYSNTMTSTRNNSLIVMGITNDTTSTGASAGTGFDTVFTSGDAAIPAGSAMQRMSSVIPTKGTSQTINPTLPASTTGNIAAIEILPAPNVPGTNMSGMV
jgi:hypothetical protein